jgi:hypothetical protein
MSETYPNKTHYQQHSPRPPKLFDTRPTLQELEARRKREAEGDAAIAKEQAEAKAK